MSNETEQVHVVSLRETFELEHLVEHYDAHFWRPRLRKGEIRVGYVCTEGDEQPPKQEDLKRLSAPPIVVRTATDLVSEDVLFQKPTRWKRVFPNGNPSEGDLCVYRAVEPEGYAALSDVAVPYDPQTESDPDPAFRCVHKALLGDSELASEPIWKDNESTWNVKGTAFFRWHGSDTFPNKVQPYALTAGTLYSKLLPGSVKIKPSEAVELTPVQFYTGYYNNSMSDDSFTKTFTASVLTSTAVTGTWQRTDSTEIANTFEVGVAITKQFGGDASFAKFITTASFKWETAITKTVSTTIGGGTTHVDSVTLTESCVVTVPPRKSVEVRAFFYRGSYDLSYEGTLRLAAETAGAAALEIPIKGTFGVTCDTMQTWWDVGDGTFVTKKQTGPADVPAAA